MSYFGKKALVWWDYENHTKENVTRFNHSNLEIQHQILEKWYPKGMLFKRENDSTTYRINEYVKGLVGWLIEYKPVDEFEKVKFSISQSSNVIHPLIIFPLNESILPIKRSSKLNRLLK
jgi:hypothetical protein